jgi:hypothetical protein
MDLEADGMVGMESGLAYANGGSLDDYNFKFTVGKWGGFDIGDGEYFMEDFKSLVESKPQFFVKTEQFKDYFETTYIANPFDVEDLKGATDKEYIEMFEFADTYLTSKLDIVNQLKNNNQIGIYNIVPSKKTGKIEIGDMAWYDLGLNGLGSIVSHTPTKESPKYEELQQLYKENFSYDYGGITPIDANIEGDSVDVVESDFAKGGVVYDTTKPKLEKVTIKETRFNRASVIGRNASNANELQDIIIDYVRNSPEEIDWIKFYVNDATRGSYYIDLNKGKKNTVKNVNTETVNPQNIKRVIDAKDYLVKNYDWTDFFEGANNKTVRKGKTVDTINVIYFDTNGKDKIIQDIGNPIQLYNFLKKLLYDGKRYAEIQPSGNGILEYPKSVNITTSVWQDILFVKPKKEAIEAIMNTVAFSLFPKSDFSKFNSRYTSTSLLNKSDFAYKKIKVDGNTDLALEVAKKLKELGFFIAELLQEKLSKNDIPFGLITDSKTVGWDDENEFNKSSLKEIFPTDFDIQTPTITTASTSAQPFDFAMTKIDVMDNVDLSARIQQKAFEDGWEWENGGGKNTKNFPFNYMYFTKTSISYGNTNSSFDNSPKREITEAEIFGSQLPNSNSDKEVTKIRLVYDTGTLKLLICNNGSELFDNLKLIEEEAEGGSLEVKITLSGIDKNNGFFETQGITQDIGKGGFEPRQIYSFEK